MMKLRKILRIIRMNIPNLMYNIHKIFNKVKTNRKQMNKIQMILKKKKIH